MLGMLGYSAAVTAVGAYRFIAPNRALAGPNAEGPQAPAPISKNQGGTSRITEISGALRPERAELFLPALAIVRNGGPRQLVDAAIEALGGMSRFVSKGDKVLLKPNIGWDRASQFAANTNPEAVARVVELCLQAGAKRVTVMDRTCNDPRRSYQNSGIEAAAKKAGAVVLHTYDRRVKQVDLRGEVLRKWDVFDEVLAADVKINMPIAKNHAIAGVTLGMKNWMGCVGGDRGKMHQDIHTSVVDLAAFFKPNLTILDAYRILVANGPSSGSLADVRTVKTLCAGADPVAVDTFGISLFDVERDEMTFVSKAEKRGLGKRNWRTLRVREIDLPSVKG
ncbi:MAG: DUF362 domain-containing protein [Deltaproteobacteria bacterium]|nr:DUF362 domain-containing protein [Deltaproteobacteria bacterium]